MSSVPWVKNTLDITGSHYRESRHAEANTAQEMAKKEHVTGHRVAKTVAVKADDQVLLLILPASRKVSLERVRRAAGARSVRLLNEGEIAFHFPDCEVGAIPPLRHWSKVDLWLDSNLGTEKEILFPGGTHTDAVRMPFGEWIGIAKPRIESFSLPECEGDDWRDE